MKKLLWGIFSLLFLLSVANGQILDHPYSLSAYPDRIILNATTDLSNSIAINWRTADSIQTSFVDIVVASSDPRDFLKSKRHKAQSQTLKWPQTQTANYHSITITDLQPNTKYAYRVGQGTTWSEWMHFTTTSESTTPLTFLYFGDVQVEAKPFWSRVALEAYRKAPDAKLAIYGGDLINKANRDIEWGEWFKAGMPLHTSMANIMTPGNHDHFDIDEVNTISAFWRPQFNLPLNGPTGLEETCYYTDIQGVRFISINSDQIEESDIYLTSQKEWLEKILQNNPNRWTIVVQHHPIYSPKATRDNPRLRNAFKPLFDKYKVDLVLQGHDHTYARGMVKVPMENKQKSGTMYVVSVSGPKMTGSHVEKAAWMDRKAIFTQLYHVITVHPNVLQFNTYTATSELYDSFELVKQKGNVNKVIDKIPPTVPER